MKRGVRNDLSKNYILSKIPQEEIFAKYFNIDVSDIEMCLQSGKLIHSPIRNDPNASFGFSYNNKGKLKARDFGGYFWGDCFDAVAYVLSASGKLYNVANKQDFYTILKHIAFTFRFCDFGNVEFDADNHIKSNLSVINDRDTIIELVVRDWNKADIELWNTWGVDINYLNQHSVYPIDQYYVDRYANPEPKYYYRSKDPAYAYMLGINSRGVHQIKVYSPRRERNRGRFITNARCLEGMMSINMTVKYDLIILTKSSKDRLSLGCHLQKYNLLPNINYAVLNMPHEASAIREVEYKFLLDRVGGDSTKILCFLDFDATGRRTAKAMQVKYGIPYMFITNGLLGLNNYGAKDFAELKERYNDEVINEMILETCEIIEELIMRQFQPKQQSMFNNMNNGEEFEW